MTVNHVRNIMNGLHDCYAERYCNLKNLKIATVGEFNDDGDAQHESYCNLVKDEINSFLRLGKVMENLEVMDLEFGGEYAAKIKIAESFLDPLLLVLSNISQTKGLIKLRVWLPRYVGSNAEIKQIQSMKVVKELSRLLSKQDEESKLETIVLSKISRLNFSNKALDFLTFTFGYDNKMYIQNNNKYYLSFKWKVEWTSL